MSEKKSYYRNWYQQWEEEKRQEAKQQAMNYFSDMEAEGSPGDLDLYGKKELYQDRQEAIYLEAGAEGEDLPHHHKDFYQREGYRVQKPVPFKEEPVPRLPRDRSRQAVKRRGMPDALRGLLIGVPAALVLLALLWVGGFIPEEVVDRFLGVSHAPEILELLADHDAAMNTHNDLNHSIAAIMSSGELTLQAQGTLRAQLAEASGAVAAVAAHEGASTLSSLWQVKQQSILAMTGYLLEGSEVTHEAVTYFNHTFVLDQNDIGAELDRALTSFLESNGVAFLPQPDGSFQLR